MELVEGDDLKGPASARRPPSPSPAKSPTLSRPPTKKASSTATSSPPTSSSRPTAPSSFSTSASPKPPSRAPPQPSAHRLADPHPARHASRRDPGHRRLHVAEQARGKPSISAPISGPSASCSTKCSPASILFAAGDTVTDILAAVVTREPDYSALPEDSGRYPPPPRTLSSKDPTPPPRYRRSPHRSRRAAAPAPAPAHPAARPSKLPLDPRRRPRDLSRDRALLRAPAGCLGRRGSLLHCPRPELLLIFSPPAISPDGRQIAYISERPPGSPPHVPPPSGRDGRAGCSRNRGTNHSRWSPDSRRSASWRTVILNSST